MSLITKPGVYDIPIEAYHNTEICPAPSIGGSGLVNLAPPDGVPAKFWWDSTLNPKRERTDTVALRVGKCAHTLFLEGIDAVQRGFVIDNLTREGKGSRTAVEAFEEKAKAEGKIVIREEKWTEVQQMVRAMDRYPLIRAAFTDGRAEPTLVWQDDETGVYLRTRPDWLPRDPTHMPEFKTARSAGKYAFSNAIEKYGYHIKAVHLMAGVRALGLGDPKTFTHYVLESAAPFLAAIHTLPRETLELAEVQYRAAVRAFAICLERNDWPGYPEAPQETGLPGYILKRLQDADLTGSQQEPTNEQPKRRYTAEDYVLAC